MGGSHSGHASVGSRARSSARWGSRGRTGRGGAGRGRKRPRRDYETRPAESPARLCSGTEALCCALQGRGRGLGSPRGPPPCRANPGRWALEEGLLQPPGTVRNRAFPLRAGCCRAKRKRSPGILRPQPSSEIRRSTPPSRSSCTLPQMEVGARLFTHCEGGEAIGREGLDRIFFLILENTSSNSKSLNRGIKGHSSFPSLSEVKIF